MSVEILALTSKGVYPLNVNTLTAVGGQDSSGVMLEGLKQKGEYAVLSLLHDRAVIHPLKGRDLNTLELPLYRRHVIDDLTLLVVPGRVSEVAPSPWENFHKELMKIVSALGDPNNLEKSLDCVLQTLLDDLHMEKGLLITRDLHGQFKAIAQRGVNPDDKWLSETLILDALTKKQVITVQNVIGSPYHSNKSLMGTGFLSVFAWPLVVRGEVLGVLLTGSQRPHSGLTQEQRTRADLIVQLAALVFNFHLRDLRNLAELSHLRRQTEDSEESPLLTNSPSVVEVVRVAKQVAATDLAILIQGETGVGKEVLTQWIHRQSDRSDKPFVAVNCGAIPSELLESLLFGHRKGAFTGAESDRMGKFQLAHMGTLFLDEIGDLPEYLQVKLLRVIQEKAVEPVGHTRPIPADVRIIAASNKPILELVRAGKFREDLYYRLAEVTLQIPALRDRPEDIKLLAVQFRKKFGPDKMFAREVLDWLAAQEWKGNVRELMSTVKRGAILASTQEIQISDLVTGVPVAPVVKGVTVNWLGGNNLEDAKNEFVRSKVREALLRSDGKRNKAAELLGVAPRTFFRYLEDLQQGEAP